MIKIKNTNESIAKYKIKEKLLIKFMQTPQKISNPPYQIEAINIYTYCSNILNNSWALYTIAKSTNTNIETLPKLL